MFLLSSIIAYKVQFKKKNTFFTVNITIILKLFRKKHKKKCMFQINKYVIYKYFHIYIEIKHSILQYFVN